MMSLWTRRPSESKDGTSKQKDSLDKGSLKMKVPKKKVVKFNLLPTVYEIPRKEYLMKCDGGVLLEVPPPENLTHVPKRYK